MGILEHVEVNHGEMLDYPLGTTIERLNTEFDLNAQWEDLKNPK